MELKDKAKKAVKAFIIKVVLIIIAVILLAALFYAIVTGIRNVFDGAIEEVKCVGKNLWDAVKRVFNESTVDYEVIINKITDDHVSTIRDRMDLAGIDANNNGMTNVMISKMLLANAVTSSTDDTICVAEVNKEDILVNTNETDVVEYLQKNNTRIETFGEDEKLKQMKGLKKYKYYTKYYITDKFFYFRDEDATKMIDESDTEGRWYLGIMGAISIYRDGEEMKSTNTLDKAFKDYQGGDMKALNAYVKTENGVKVLSPITTRVEYRYKMNNPLFDDGKLEVIESGSLVNETDKNKIITEIDFKEDIDLSVYAIPIDLMLNMLTFTGSPEYVDEFIDYAIEEQNVTIKLYPLKDIETTDEKLTYDIKNDFIYELYSMYKEENMVGFGELIYNRKDPYNNKKITSVLDYLDYEIAKDDSINENIDEFYKYMMEITDKGKNTDYFHSTQQNIYVKKIDPNSGIIYEEPQVAYEKIIDWEKVINDINSQKGTNWSYIKYEKQEKLSDGSNEYILKQPTELDMNYTKNNNIKEEIKDKKLIRVPEQSKTDKLGKYLICAHDGEVQNSKVQKNKITITETTTWKATVSKVETWYGYFEKSLKTKSKKLYINDKEVKKENFYIEGNENNGFSIDNFSVGTVLEKKPDVTIEERFIYPVLYDCVDQEEDGIVTYPIEYFSMGKAVKDDKQYNKDELNDFEKNLTNLDRYGIGLLSSKDKGSKGKNDDIEERNDYLYHKFTKQNITTYEMQTALEQEKLDENTEVINFKGKDEINQFLGLWRNKTGEIDGGIFDKDGIEVLYDDIYGTKTGVGGIFESSLEMFLDVLQGSDSTANFVEIFKYIMFIYTNEDLGVTDLTDVTIEIPKPGENIGMPGDAPAGNSATIGIFQSPIEYTSKMSNRTFKTYTQCVNNAEYNKPLVNSTIEGSTVASAGCAITSVAIIASGYGSDKTPTDLNRGEFVHTNNLEYATNGKYTFVQIDNDKNDDYEKALRHLKNGGEIMIKLERKNGKNKVGVFGKAVPMPTEKNPKPSHFMAIVDYDDESKKIYVVDPAKRYTGWWPVSAIKDVARYDLVVEV